MKLNERKTVTGKPYIILKSTFILFLFYSSLVFLAHSKVKGQDIPHHLYISDPILESLPGHRLCEGTPTSVCCVYSDGCFGAIIEGQAEFYTLIVLPDLDPTSHLFMENLLRENSETTSPFFDNLGCYISNDPELNKNLTAEEAFNCETAENTTGESLNMGKLYMSIWWEIYNHEETSKEDIMTIFTEHLPLVSRDDTFRTVASKIIGKSRELFDETRSEQYAHIISEEFTRRGLSPIEKTAE